MKFACERVQQLTVSLENRPGILADLCAHLCDGGVNVRAMMTLESTDAGTVRIVVDKPDEAREMLSAAAVAHTTAECLAVLMPNYPGGLAEVARELQLGEYLRLAALTENLDELEQGRVRLRAIHTRARNHRRALGRRQELCDLLQL